MHPRAEIALDTSTPVLLLGGGTNSVAVAQSLHRAGITVRISGGEGAWGIASRFCTQTFPVPHGRDQAEWWSELLLSPGPGPLEGHLILPLCDHSIVFLCEHRDALAERYLLEDFVPELRLEMMDKLATLARGHAAGVPVPKYWKIASIEDVRALRNELTYPVMVKPIHSHLFVEVFGRKLFIIESGFDLVLAKAALALDRGLEIMIVEMIPGPDHLLSSYYTYIDAEGRSLFHYTKRIIRRFPVHRGGGCYHVAEWLPETAEMGQRFFASMPWRGMANIEFKRDLRDGQLKVIEVNPRFTAAHRLLVEGGMPIDLAIYRRLTCQNVPTLGPYEQNLRLWNPTRDFLAFIEMRRRGELTFSQWIRSVMEGRKVLPMFTLSDPMPSIVRLGQEGGRALRIPIGAKRKT
jgi:predicted ATP-grasp superfamily ATP-dependent carboligase